MKSPDINDTMQAEGVEGVRRRLADAKPYAGNGKVVADDAPQEASQPVPRFDEWMEREIPQPDLLCGTYLTTTSRVLITGPTGLGKTMFAVAIAFSCAAGTPLLHWGAGREARILYVDGEMSRREMRRRLRDESRRSGLKPKNLFILSKEDFDDMPPLNTEAGQTWMDAKIEEVKPDLGIFDNIQSLVEGDHTKPESWSPVLPWMRLLTKRHIGQIWLHHTGHNEGHSYGTKTREWQLDTCILMKRVSDESEHLTFSLEFTKARERRPDNREEFATVTIALVEDRWVITEGGVQVRKKVPSGAKIALTMLKRAILEGGIPAPDNIHYPGQPRVVSNSLWEKYCRQGSITKGDSVDAFRKAFARSAEKLQELGLIGVWGEHVWPTD